MFIGNKIEILKSAQGITIIFELVYNEPKYFPITKFLLLRIIIPQHNSYKNIFISVNRDRNNYRIKREKITLIVGIAFVIGGAAAITATGLSTGLEATRNG